MIIGDMQVANRAFVALAVEAGIEAVIKSLVPLASDMTELLLLIRVTLRDTNPQLGQALNVQTLFAILDYMALKGDAPVLRAERLPRLLNEDGPASTSAARDGGVSTQVNVTYTEPPSGYTGEIYLDGVFAKHSTAAAVSGFVNDSIPNVVAGAHTIRVLFRSPAGDITRFGSIVNIS